MHLINMRPIDRRAMLAGVSASLASDLGRRAKGGGRPAPFYFRQNTASDLGDMVKRVGTRHLMLTPFDPAAIALQVGRS